MAGKAVTIRDYKSLPGGLLNATTWSFPTVKSVNSHSRATEWTLLVRCLAPGNETKQGAELEAAFLPLEPELANAPSPNYGWMIVHSGVVGGKIRDTVPTIVYSGKNLKASHATNPVCQAMRDALGMYNKQCRKVATEVVAEAQADGSGDRYPPMLAQVIKWDKIDWDKPVYCQRKFNGVRVVSCIERGEVVMYSRSKIAYPGFAEIKAELLQAMIEYPGVFLDGEAYKHGTPLNEISGKARGGTTDELEVNYMVYDCFMPSRPDMKYSERLVLLTEILRTMDNTLVKPVETLTPTTEAQAWQMYKQFRDEGYEGAMIRLDEPYRYSYNGHHCTQLLKIKPTYDDEYEIVGWLVGKKGKAAKALMLRCTIGDVPRRNIVNEAEPVDPRKIDPKDRVFDVTPMGTIEDRIRLAEQMAQIQPSTKTFFEENWLGKKITIYFAELSPYGVPQQGRTKMEMRVD